MHTVGPRDRLRFAKTHNLDPARIDINPGDANASFRMVERIATHGIDLDPSATWIVLSPWCNGSDYGGCSVTRANYDTMLDMVNDIDPCTGDTLHAYILDLFGGHGSYGIAVRLDMPDCLWDVISSLADYPCIDDERVSALEMEWQQEAMLDLISDVQRIAYAELPDDGDRMSDAARERYDAAIKSALESAELEWECEHASAYCKPEKAWTAIRKDIDRDRDMALEACAPVSDDTGETRIEVTSEDGSEHIDVWSTRETDVEYVSVWCDAYYGRRATVNIYTPSLHPLDV